MTAFLTALTVWLFIMLAVVWPICALAKRRDRAPYTTTPEGARLALLLAQAYAAKRIKVGEPIYVESVVHPSGAKVPVRIYGESAVGDVIAEEAEEWLEGRGA